jgi:hypothetical protein
VILTLPKELTIFLVTYLADKFKDISSESNYMVLGNSEKVVGFVDGLYKLRGRIEKFQDWPPGARTANGTALCHSVQLYRYFVSQYSEFCRHKPLCCFSTSAYYYYYYYYLFIYFVIDSVWKRLDTLSYMLLEITTFNLF